jgi:hypothetical protein
VFTARVEIKNRGISIKLLAEVPSLALMPINWERPMSEKKHELLEKLKFELAFAEDGGYGRSVHTPHQSTSPFQDSLTCLNFGDPLRSHPCAECVLMQYVPESHKGEDVPCHHIPLDQEREPSPLWIPPGAKKPSSGGFAKESPGWRENLLYC